MLRSKLFLILTIFTLSACETIQSINPFGGEEEQTAVMEAETLKCPLVSIVSDASSLTELRQTDETAPASIIARATLNDFDGGCDYDDKGVYVGLDLKFSARLDPSIDVSKDNILTVPYFVAITNPDGSIATKEVFEVSFTFEAGENHTKRIEELKQYIPLSDQMTGQKYQIMAGFQLSKQQLEYNRSLQVKRGPVVFNQEKKDTQ